MIILNNEEKTTVSCDFSINHFINADKQQIEQVIINIISNCIYALKNIKKPKIEIYISSKNSRVKVSIIDNGIGISKAIKSNVFVPYFTTRKNGSGIGLALAKSIMEAHGGNINFKSENNNTSFVLSFLN